MTKKSNERNRLVSTRRPSDQSWEGETTLKWPSIEMEFQGELSQHGAGQIPASRLLTHRRVLAAGSICRVAGINESISAQRWEGGRRGMLNSAERWRADTGPAAAAVRVKGRSAVSRQKRQLQLLSEQTRANVSWQKTNVVVSSQRILRRMSRKNRAGDNVKMKVDVRYVCQGNKMCQGKS